LLKESKILEKEIFLRKKSQNEKKKTGKKTYAPNIELPKQTIKFDLLVEYYRQI